MKKNETPPPKPTQQEKELLEKYIVMEHWQFDQMFGPVCIEIDSYTIAWEKDAKGNNTAVRSYIYGYNAIYTESKKPCIANFFIRNGLRVYQRRWIEAALPLQKLFKKEYERDEYDEKVRDQKYELLEAKRKVDKVMKAEKASKAKQKKLSPVKKVA